jgi:hypothetical protein
MTKEEFKQEMICLFPGLVDLRIYVAEDGSVSFQGIVK